MCKIKNNKKGELYMKTMIASCGEEIREDEGFVCPYCLGRGKPGFSNCGVNLQYGTNVCMESIPLDPEEFYVEEPV